MRALDSLNADSRRAPCGSVTSGEHTRLGHAASLSEPALHDELAGVAGREVAKPVTSLCAGRYRD